MRCFPSIGTPCMFVLGTFYEKHFELKKDTTQDLYKNTINLLIHYRDVECHFPRTFDERFVDTEYSYIE